MRHTQAHANNYYGAEQTKDVLVVAPPKLRGLTH